MARHTPIVMVNIDLISPHAARLHRFGSRTNLEFFTELLLFKSSKAHGGLRGRQSLRVYINDRSSCLI